MRVKKLRELLELVQDLSVVTDSLLVGAMKSLMDCTYRSIQAK
jgi:hypothetical protein